MITMDERADGLAAALRRLWPTQRLVKTLGVLVLTVLLAGGGVMARRAWADQHTRPASTAVPQSVAMEELLGVRFSRVAVVADGGLLTLSYVVLDSEKALRFQSDVTHPPRLTSEARKLSTVRVSLMKQGHALRTGQTYYLVYENTRGAIRAGEKLSITDGAVTLAHVPVL
jgi:hypothetical protein